MLQICRRTTPEKETMEETGDLLKKKTGIEETETTGVAPGPGIKVIREGHEAAAGTEIGMKPQELGLQGSQNEEIQGSQDGGIEETETTGRAP